MKRITKTTVAVLLTKLDTKDLTVELDSQCVTFWYDSSTAAQKRALKACKAVVKATGAATIRGNGYKYWVNYKVTEAPSPDFEGVASRMHY